MERIVIRHLSGSKANQVEEFPLNHFSEIILGRDPSATVKYDPDRDDLVGRQHARIAADPNDSNQFTVSDLNSRNGTYVNKQRIVSATKIAPGDHIQLGPGGPEFQFDLEPRPMNTVKATRSAAFDPLAPTVQGASGSVPSTRQVDLGMPATRSVNLGTPAGSSSSTGTVGKATVERMISQNIAVTKRAEGRKYLMIGGVALAVLVLAFGTVAAYLYSKGSSADSQVGQLKKELASAATMDSTAIAKTNKRAVVKIDVSWKLISPQGGLVYHQYGCDNMPCFIELKDGTIEPLLSYDKERFGNTSPAIGGKFTASGVVISNDGFILTNRHVGAAWETVYNFPPEMTSVTVLGRDGRPNTVRNLKTDPIRWIPSETKQVVYTLRGKERVKEGEFNGQNERLDVFFPNMMERNVAQLKKSHEDYDLSLIKVDIPGGLPKAELYDSLKETKQGDATFVMGYQRVSIPVFGYKEESISSRQSQQKEIPDPNVVAGNIGRLIMTQDSSGNRQKAFSEIGNAYQLSVSTQDAGYDGGPVFDNRGRVIGIYSLEKRLEVPTTIAIPIHYGIQLTSIPDSGK
ncbi:MAG TPA: FHA domain-containing protein [Pyrinomonadaceae bacterium]|jgi:S1-C subfamily serine protease